jgi:tetratricopeptide (TPR) repeat protein
MNLRQLRVGLERPLEGAHGQVGAALHAIVVAQRLEKARGAGIDVAQPLHRPFGKAEVGAAELVGGLGIAGGEIAHRPVLLDRGGRPSRPLVGARELPPDEAVLRLQLQRRLQRCDRFAHTAQREQAAPHHDARSRIGGVEADGLAAFRDGLPMPPLLLMDDGEVVVDVGLSSSTLEHAAKGRFRVREAAGLECLDAALERGLGRGGVLGESDRGGREEDDEEESARGTHARSGREYRAECALRPMPAGRVLLCSVLIVSAAAVRASPQAPAVGEALSGAQALLERGDRAGARGTLAAALRAFPAHPVLQNFLGVVEAQDGHYAAAEAHFQGALRAAPRYTDASLNLGRLYQENVARDPGALRKALATYEAVLAYDPKHTESLYQSAVVRRAAGDFKGSLERITRLPAEERARAQVLALRLADEVGAGRHAEADRSMEALLERPDLTEPDVLAILPGLVAGGAPERAIRLLERVRARGLASETGLRRLAEGYEATRRLDAARDALEAVAGLRPADVPLLLDLARVAQGAGDRQGALGYLAHARGLDPKDARVHFLFGMLCVELGLGVEAYNSLKEAVRLDPGNAAVNYAMGAVALHRRDPSEAVPFFKKYAELTPGDPRGALAVGLAFFQARDFAAARPELARAAQSPFTQAAAQYFLARIAAEEGDLDAALDLLGKALAREPAYADAWAERGFVHFRRREMAEAEKDLQRSLELDPDNHLGNLHLLALYQRTKDARQEAQARRVQELDARREEQTEEFRRVIQVQPH